MSAKLVKDLQTQLKRESKSFEAIQQGTIIALLNTFGFGFEFKRPERIAEKTLQFLIIVEVYYNQKPLEFGKKIDVYCDEQFQAEVDDKMSINQIKSLKRRRDLNRAALSFNWLIEYVQQFGYMIERRSTKSAKKTLQMEKINKVYKRNGYYFTAAEIHNIGKEMNAYIIKQFVKIEKTTKLAEFNAFCSELIKKYDRRTIPQAPSQATTETEAKKEEQKEKETTEKKETKEAMEEDASPVVPATQPTETAPTAPPTTAGEITETPIPTTSKPATTTPNPPTAPAVEVNPKETKEKEKEGAPAETPMEEVPLASESKEKDKEAKSKEEPKKAKVTPPAPKMDKKRSKKDKKKKNHREKKPQKTGKDSETVEED